MTPEAIKDRLREMARTDKRARDVMGPFPSRPGDNPRGGWPDVAWTAADIHAYNVWQAGLPMRERDKPKLTLLPSNAELERMWEVQQEWLPLIADDQTRLIVVQWAYRVPWRDIARNAATNRRQAQRLLNDGVRTIAGLLKLRAA